MDFQIYTVLEALALCGRESRWSGHRHLFFFSHNELPRELT